MMIGKRYAVEPTTDGGSNHLLFTGRGAAGAFPGVDVQVNLHLIGGS